MLQTLNEGESTFYFPVLNHMQQETDIGNKDSDVEVRERFTNILVRIATYREQGISSANVDEYDELRKEASQILFTNPEWRDVAKSWIPSLK